MTSQPGGYDCEFVEKPPKAVQFECPICLLVLKEPYQVSCCGYGFCKLCILKIKELSQPCPCCNTEYFDHFHDKRLKRSLSELKVNCLNESRDCSWTGELGDLEEHLNLNPLKEKQLKGCKYAKIECLHCDKLIERYEIETHQENCPKRPFSCDYCEKYDSYFEDVTTNHWPVCGYYPMPCPNKCGETLQRQNLDSHITNDCPLTIIDCDFQHVGCEVRLPRKEMSAHLEENVVRHLSLQAAHYRREMTRVEEDNCHLRQQMLEYQRDLVSYDKKLTKLENELRPQVEWLTKELQILLQPKKKAAKRRWKKLAHVANVVQWMQQNGGEEQQEDLSRE